MSPLAFWLRQETRSALQLASGNGGHFVFDRPLLAWDNFCFQGKYELIEDQRFHPRIPVLPHKMRLRRKTPAPTRILTTPWATSRKSSTRRPTAASTRRKPS